MSSQDNHPVPFSPQAVFRIGPVVLAARGAVDAGGPLEDFAVSPDASPRLVLLAEKGEPLSRPDSPLVTTSRTGWDVYKNREGLLALKAIPHGSDRILRSVTLGLEGGRASLQISPEDDRPERPFAYTLSELLVLLLTRVTGSMLVHSACVEVDGRALLFSGASGSGKSTMAELWDRSGEGEVLGDESHLLWIDREGRVMASGTPWPGSSGLYSNRTAPLAGIFFLRHGPENLSRALGKADAAITLLSHSFLPSWDALSMEIVSELGARVAEAVPAADLAFAPDERVVEYLMKEL